VIGAVLLVGFGLFASSFAASPLPMPAAYAGPLPSASPPAAMEVFQLPTGVTHRRAAFAYRGGSFFDRRDFAMTAVLVRHPRGDVLIDTGFGRNLDAQLALMPRWFRATTPLTRTLPAADRLETAGYDRAKLRGILLTHAHWDHASGVCDFPGTPVMVAQAERRFVDEGGWITAVARSCSNVRYEELAFESGPYLGYPRSHDLHGDGAIVVVPAPGHTPGSVNVFLTLPNGKRYVLVGDLVWQREGITEREERPWPIRTLADSTPEEVRAEILHLASLMARFPDLEIVPAHDSRGFAEMRALEPEPRGAGTITR
jgi:N-acyl homoserine lactone hydrolase